MSDDVFCWKNPLDVVGAFRLLPNLDCKVVESETRERGRGRDTQTCVGILVMDLRAVFACKWKKWKVSKISPKVCTGIHSHTRTHTSTHTRFETYMHHNTVNFTTELTWFVVVVAPNCFCVSVTRAELCCALFSLSSLQVATGTAREMGAMCSVSMCVWATEEIEEKERGEGRKW